MRDEMSEPKVIELTEEQVFNLFTGDDLTIRQRDEAVTAVKNGGLLIKAPQPKLVHLSDLPDGTKIGVGAYVGWMHNGEFWLRKTANEYYEESINVHGKNLRLKKGGWLPWLGGECPWPEFVEVETLIADSEKVMKPWIMNGGEEYAGCWTWQKGHKQVIAHRCTGRLLDGAKLVP